MPQIIVPHLLDQFYWANRVQTLRLGPLALPFDRLTAVGLAERIKVVLEDSSFGRRAACLGREISARDGLADSVRVVEDLA